MCGRRRQCCTGGGFVGGPGLIAGPYSFGQQNYGAAAGCCGAGGYGGYGGIAYHHVADNYVALFTHFIACGVWEAVYIIDGLLKNASELQPKAVASDTQTSDA